MKSLRYKDYHGIMLVAAWFVNVLTSIDQLVNTIFGGDPDETISSRLGKLEKKYDGKIPRRRPLSAFLVWALNKIDPGHCEKGIEDDEGRHQLRRD